ncbi:TetR/AcrR family transcriptional regulator [Actinoplanes sp. NBC_00393]|uniref:TetR/AcrR family transcriptional regulator n=1 Tax=Actinoplanes sp. NBC_00393 TaxID=2975953 RepID=UPI002E23601E
MSDSAPKPDGRAARSRASRTRVARAATGLFIAGGYAGTSVGAIAKAAGVSEQSVYYLFGTKRAVLVAALDQAIAGDDEPIPTLQRDWVHDAVADPDPHGQIERQVAGVGEVLRRAAPLLDIVRNASTDPELAEVCATTIGHHQEVQRFFAEALAAKTALRCAVDAAADTAVALLSPETYLLLVDHLGWSHDRWCRWAVDCLTRTVID